MAEAVPRSPYAPWAAAIHTSPATDEADPPLGAGVVIDYWRVLTCEHVIADRRTPKSPLWIAFPKATGVPRMNRSRVADVRLATDPLADLAVLELAEPVPPEVVPARLRSPEPEDLDAERWWAFGFPQGHPFGNVAHGIVGAILGNGRIRLDTDSPYGIEPGFSGAGVWSPGWGVVGLVEHAQSGGEGTGNALAITLRQASQELPYESLAGLAAWSVEQAGETALAAWGWMLTRDAEARQHWRPRARGVPTDDEHGWRFRGRRAALTRLVEWLDRPAMDRRVLVVTGSPGVGKSAVLGRVVTTADPGIRSALPEHDDAVKATIGSVHCAVHAKGKTALDVAKEVAKAVPVRIPEELAELVPALRERLAARPDGPDRRFHLVIDALDEATDPEQARLIVEKLVLPMARAGTKVGVRVVVGTRRRDGGGDLLGTFGETTVVDLDAAEYFAQEDLAAYALATLQQAGNAYTDAAVAAPVAARIAELAEPNFLVAALVARQHAERDDTAVDPATLDFTADVDDALRRYVQALPPVGQAPAVMVLTALAYTEAPGLSLDLWSVFLAGLGIGVTAGDLAGFIGSSAGNFLVESSSEGEVRRYRLFHQALDDALLRERASARRADERAIASELIASGRQSGWAQADPYLWRSLPAHADRAGLLDALLDDDEFLLYADMPRLTPLAGHAATGAGRSRARLLRLTPAANAGPAERAGLFSVTAALEGLGAVAGSHPAAYRARWAEVAPRAEWSVLEGHADDVRALCTVPAGGRVLLASAGDDQTVRLWDPATGPPERTLRHEAPVCALCVVNVGGRPLLATGGLDGTVRLWSPVTGEPDRVLSHDSYGLRAVCAVEVAGRTLLAAGGGKTVSLWNPVTGELVRSLAGDTGRVEALCVTNVAGRPLLAAGCDDGTVQVWDPATGHLERLLPRREAHHIRGNVWALCSVEVGDQTRLASGDSVGLALWDPTSGELVSSLDAPGLAAALCTMDVDGRCVLAHGGFDGATLVNPATGEAVAVLPMRLRGVQALCSLQVEGRLLLASAGHDSAVRLWDASAAAAPGHGSGIGYPNIDSTNQVDTICLLGGMDHTLLATVERHQIRIRESGTGRLAHKFGYAAHADALCRIDVFGRTLLAGIGFDGVWLWDPRTDEAPRKLENPHLGSETLCAVERDGRPVLATIDKYRRLQLWDPETGRSQRPGTLRGLIRRLTTRLDRAASLCAVQTADRTLLASAHSLEGDVRLWDLADGSQVSAPGIRHVDALCGVRVAGHGLLATAGLDRTVRLWDPLTWRPVRALEGHTSWIRALHAFERGGRAWLVSGGDDRTVRVWDPATGACHLTIPVHHEVWSCAAVDDSVFVGVNTGVMAISLRLPDDTHVDQPSIP